MNAPAVPVVDPVDDDAPYAVGSDGPARRRRGLPPWAFPVIGVLVLVIAASAVYYGLYGSKPRASGKPVRVMQNEAQPAELAQTAQAAARADALAPKRPQNQSSRLTTGPLDGTPDPVVVVPVAPDTASARELVALSMQVQAIDAQLQQLVQMLSAQSPATRKIIIERVRAQQEAQAVPVSNSRKQRGFTYSSLFEVTAIVGNRAWLRRMDGDDKPDVIVGIGDRVAGSHVAEINVAEKYVVLDNGQRIR